MRTPIAALAAVLLAGCPPRALSVGPTVPTLVQVGGGQRAVQTLTDLDEVRDVSSTGERVFVATDLGLLIHPANGAAPPVRLRRDDGLPSDDVRVVAATLDGAAVVATAEGLVMVEGETVTPMTDVPPVGELGDLLVDAAGVLWACGVDGVARRGAEGWERFGERAACTTIVPTPEGHLWIGTTLGLWQVEGDVIREHGQSLLPESFVRDVVPVAEGEVMALLQGPSHAQLAYYDGSRWYGYTIADFDPAAVGIAGTSGELLLVTPDRAYAIAPSESAQGVPLTPLSRSEPRQAVGYRARITPAADVASRAAADDDPNRRVQRPAVPLAEVPSTQASIDAPGFVVSDTELPIGEQVYLVRRQPSALFIASRNIGVTSVDTAGRAFALRSRDFVSEQDLQIASSASGNAWTIGTHHDPARWRDGGLVRVPVPDGLVPEAIASGPQGVYVASLVAEEVPPPAPEPPAPEAPEAAAAPAPEAAPDAAEAAPPALSPEEAAAPPEGLATSHRRAVRIHRVSDDGWTQVAERTITTGTRLVGLPFLGVTNEEEMWLGLRVEHESGEGTRTRGVAVFGARGEGVTYHHRGADTATDGEGALRMPDEVMGVDLAQPGYAWLPGLSGAIRVGNSQAVAFGEARGVRGEVVSDLAVGDNERVWVAAAEGVGYREAGSFEFRLPGEVQRMRPTALALDSAGNLWGAGSNGAVFFDGGRWQMLTTQNGLPTNELVDVEVDAGDRVWFLARDRVMLFDAPQPIPPE